MKPMRKIQKGFSLITAIFLLVVIAALGTFAVTLSTTQQQSAALDVMGARAYQAARAGIEWGAFQALRNGVCVNTVLPAGTFPGTLSGFAVTVTCPSAIHADAAGTGAPPTVTAWIITSTATQGTGADFVSRRISVTIAR